MFLLAGTILSLALMLLFPWGQAGVLAWARAEPTVVDLTEGRVLRLKLSSRAARNLAIAKFVKDPALNPLQNPLGCPDAVPWVRLKAAGGYDSGRLALPCAEWKGNLARLTYKDREGIQGGVRLVKYQVGSLQVQWKGDSFAPVSLPLPAEPWVEVRFSWGGEDSSCGRFMNFRRNKSTIAVAGPGSMPCLPEVIPTPTPSGVPTPTSQPATPSPSPEGELCPPESDCLEFRVVPGSGDLLPDDDGVSTWLRVFDFTGAGIFANATGGDFGDEEL